MIPPHLVAGCVKRLDIVWEKSVPREIPENLSLFNKSTSVIVSNCSLSLDVSCKPHQCEQAHR